MGVKSKKKAKTRLDAYYRLAKDQGYRARSAFKLIQLNRKYDFLAKSRVLVDLCAAPGGWCQVAAKHMPVGSKIVGVDLVPIAPIRGCKTFVGDITDDKTRKMIITWLKKEPVDTVIHDGAPNVGGVWSRDLFEQNALVLSATKMACSMLKPGGWLVTKVFRSQDFHKLLWVFKQLFEKVEATKPLASRMESAEIFVVCAGYKAPKHIDPAMFNSQKVFSDVGEEKILTPSGALVIPKSNVPMGYDEFATISHRVASFMEFLRADDPKAFLKHHHELRFSTDEDKVFLKSKSSKKELVHLCGDLQQVGDGDLRRLLRWREHILKEQSRLLTEDDAIDVSDGDADSTAAEGQEEGFDFDSPEGVTRIARELLEIRKKQAKELKKKQKKLVDRKLKQIKGLINYDPTTSAEHMTETNGFDHEGITDPFADEADETGDEGFTVEKLVGVAEQDVADLMDKNWREPEELGNDPLNPVMSVNLAAQEDWDLGSGEDDEEGEETAAVNSQQLVEGQEYFMDVDNYGNYIPAQRSARVKLYEEGFDNEEVEDESMSKEDRRKQEKRAKTESALDEAGRQSKWQRHHLNIDKVLNDTFPKVSDKKIKKNAQKRLRVLEEERITMNANAPLTLPEEKKVQKRTRFETDSDDDDDDNSDVSQDFSDASDFDREDLEINKGRADSRRKKQLVPALGELTTQELVRQQRKQTLQSNRETRKQNKRNKNNTKGAEDTDFEEIPIALTDPHIRARTLAIAQKMLDPKARREILDASVNRYVFNDDDDLPDWFVKDEQRNCKVILPVTADEIEEQRRRFKELNARPSKKVMEAMGRKRRRAQRMLRGLVEKGKADPRAREKSNNLSVRKLMRSQVIKGQGKKKNKYMDSMSFGQRRREKQRLKRQK